MVLDKNFIKFYNRVMNNIFDLIIIGGGPAGVAGGVYAARKQLKTLVIAESLGGQSIVSTKITNWIGESEIAGYDLGKKLKQHLMACASDRMQVREDELVEGILQNDDKTFTVVTNRLSYTTKTILFATGTARRKLNAINAEKFDHKGIAYCATCDAPFFQDMAVAVVGGGNSAFEGVLQLVEYASQIYLINWDEQFFAHPETIEKVKQNPKVKIMMNAAVDEVTGENFVGGAKIRNTKSGELSDLAVQGIFVEIGSVPNTALVKGLVDLGNDGAIEVDARTQRTSNLGIWAAGDCTNGLYRQNNIAAGDAVKAIEDIYKFLSVK